MGLVLGIDGGGTKTKAVVLDDQQQVVAKGIGGPTNMRSIGVSTVAQNIVSLVNDLSEQLSVNKSSFDFVSLGLAGVSTDLGKQLLSRELSDLGIQSDKLVINSDAAVSLYAAHESRDGIMVIAGTGMAIFGQKNEQMIHSGGWGHLLGDEGSAYWIAVEGMKAILAEADGRGPKTILTDEVLNELQINEPSGLIDFVYGTKGKAAIAALAPLVLNSFAEDGESRRIILEAAKHLFDHVKAVDSRLKGIQNVCFVGSLIENENELRTSLKNLIEGAGQSCTDMIHTPEVAAALIALNERREMTLC